MQVTRRDLLSLVGPALLASSGSLGAAAKVVRSRKVPASDEAVANFLHAVQAGDLGTVRRSLKQRPELARAVDERGRSAYVLARLAGRESVAETLRATGLELDLVESVLAEDWERVEALAHRRPDRLHLAHPIGGTPLYAGALVGSLGLWRLRALGCESNAAPDGGSGFTPARGALECRSLTGAQIALTDILGNGGDANAPQRGGDSILHAAVRRMDAALVKLAIRKHAAVDARDEVGRTPLDLASELGWEAGARLLQAHAELPRDHRVSRFAFDLNRQPIRRPDLSDVAQDRQSEITSQSHRNLSRVRELIGKDARLTYSMSTDDELAIEASAHIGQKALIRFHLDQGAPLSLPTAVALGHREAIRFLLAWDPRLVQERGAHDFPVMHYAVFDGETPATAALLHEHGVEVDQESQGATALHWCVIRNEIEIADWLIEHGADPEAISFKWAAEGQTPLELAQARGRDELAMRLRKAGARR